MSRPVVVNERQPGCLLTLLWFIFVGSWLSAIWSIVAWLLIVSVIGLPLGLLMINRLPMVATLRRPASAYRVEDGPGGPRLMTGNVPQRPFLVRAVWFVVVGWWLSALCLIVAWAATGTLIGLPLAIWLYNRVPAITTLARY